MPLLWHRTWEPHPFACKWSKPPTPHLRLERVVTRPLPAPRGGALLNLTEREREVLSLVMVGRSNAEIAKALFTSAKTVSSHISNILRKSGTASRVDAAGWASGMGLLHEHHEVWAS